MNDDNDCQTGSPLVPAGSFSQVLQAARSGHAEAVGQLLDSCRNYLLLIANREMAAELTAKLGASDIVQQTLIAAFQNLGQFRGDSEPEFLGWLRQILRNDLYDTKKAFLFSQARNVNLEVSLNETQITNKSLDDPQTTPFSDAIVHEQQQQLHRAMAQLPDRYAQVVYLRNWRELSFVEIGDLMDLSPEAARKIWGRAIARLSDLFDQSTHCSPVSSAEEGIN